MSSNSFKYYYYSCCLSDRLRGMTSRIYGLMGKRYRPSRLAGHRVLSSVEGNALLYDSIMSGKPFAAVRFGANELTAFAAAKAVEAGILAKFPDNVLQQMTNCAGFFPAEASMMERYSSLVEKTNRRSSRK